MRAGRFTGALLVAISFAGVTGVAHGAAGSSGSTGSSDPVTVVLTPKSSAPAPNAARATAVLKARLRQLGLQGSVKPSGETLVVSLPKGYGAASPGRIVPPEVRMRPVLAQLSRVAGPDGTTATPEQVRACDVAAVTSVGFAALTSVDDDRPDVCIVAETPAGKSPASRFLLGPAALVGTDIKSAKSRFASGTGDVVLLDLTKSGLGKFNALAGDLYGKPSPTDEVALVFDRTVLSTPAFQASSFTGPVQISGDFTRQETQDLADVANVGAGPLGAYEITKVATG